MMNFKIPSIIVTVSLIFNILSSATVSALDPASALGFFGLAECLKALGAEIIGSAASAATSADIGISLDDFGLGSSGSYVETDSNVLLQDYFNYLNLNYSDDMSGLSDQELNIYMTDPAKFDDYYNNHCPYSTLQANYLGCLAYLSSVHLGAQQGKVISDGLKMLVSGTFFSNALDNVTSEVCSGLLGSSVTSTLTDGARRLGIQSKDLTFYPALASRFNARNVYRFYLNDFTNYSVEATGQILIPISKVDKKTLYYVFIGTEYFSPAISITWDFNYEAEAFKSFVDRFYNSYCYAFNGNFAFSRSNSFDYGLYALHDNLKSPGNFYSFSRSYGDRVSNYSCKPISGFPYGAAFEFSTEEEAVAFVEYLSKFTTTSDYDPSKDEAVPAGEDVHTVPRSLYEDIIDYYDSLGKSTDLAVSTDGTISISDTDVKETANDEDFKEYQQQQAFSMGLEPNFDIYDQIKELLNNLFNYNDVNTPPNFKFYYDSNVDGTSETYDVLDLSVLETTLTNDNMQDKSWWSTPIKVIDIIRYIIAAVLYGLFAVRLIKRLPTFYGSGPWSTL